jgi:hypothetical protein
MSWNNGNYLSVMEEEEVIVIMVMLRKKRRRLRSRSGWGGIYGEGQMEWDGQHWEACFGR